jgi:hypothetical protein
MTNVKTTFGVTHYDVGEYWTTAKCWEDFPKVLQFCKSIGITDLTEKDLVRTVFVKWVQQRTQEKYPFVLWLYLDVCSHLFGIEGYSPGYNRGWERGVGAFLKEGMDEETFSFITTN